MTADLAARAVACKGWRWLTGMLAAPSEGMVTPPLRLTDERHRNYADEYDWPHDLGLRLPDLYDPATLGCLLTLVREAWGDPYLCCVGDRDTGWRLDGYAAVEDIHSYRSEAEALVRALEKAP